MIVQVLAWSFLSLAAMGCPDDPVPPCTCTMIGYHASTITCSNVNNEMELEKSLLSMKSTKFPIRTLEIFDSQLNYLPSEAFQGLKVPKIFIAGSSIVSLSDSDTAFVGLEDSLTILQIHETTFLSGWDWSLLRNLKALKELLLVKVGPIEVDEDVKEIAHLDINTLSLTQNSISYLHDSAFSTFINLKTLSLKVNPIKMLKRSMFPDPAPHLQQLILSQIELEHLPEDIFTNMPELQSLSLRQNNLLTIDQKTFTPVWSQLKKIDLTDNPLRCDCRMTWLLGVSFPLNTWAQCHEPKQLKDRDVKKLAAKDLWC